jgi:hypothetical protein
LTGYVLPDSATSGIGSALKALAQVRRLQVPLSVQVNVATAGGQQVNVAGDLPPARSSGGS